MKQIFVVTLATYEAADGHSSPLTLIFIRTDKETWDEFMNRAVRNIETCKLIQMLCGEPWWRRGVKVVISVQAVYDHSFLDRTLQVFIKKHLKKLRIRVIDNRMW